MLAFGLTVSLIGLASVFAVLILLVTVIKLIGMLAAYLDKTQASAAIRAMKEPTAPDRKAKLGVHPSLPDEQELAAVIAAALALYSQTEGARRP